MRYCDEDIEFAGQILTNREELDDTAVELWMKDKEHVRLLDELATVRERLAVEEFGHLEMEELTRLKQSVADRRSRRMTLRWSVAASIVLIAALFIGRMVDEWRNLDEERLIAQTERIAPGVKAELILATGEKVCLGQKSEMIAGKKEIGIRNDSLTGLDYAMAKMQNDDGEAVFNMIRVPIGGFYQLTLADGTRVWLNSMTDIRYPVTFTGESREVYLKGEAYFEVSKDTSKPFIVRLNGSKVTVLGTSFNIKAYEDENNIYTSLVQGAVRFTNDGNREQVELKPGMQCIWNSGSGKTEVYEVDMEQFVSWKDGRFVFELITLDAMMRQLKRWYDIDVVYQDEKVKTYEFWGTIDRNMDLNKVLSIVAKVSKVAFEVQGKTVFVSAKK